MKILIIGATHGNELLGPRLYRRLLQNYSPLLEHIDFIIGNPRAYATHTRYTEHDLNRSYGVIGDSYEHQRAQEIACYIGLTHPDIVLDMHTTACIQPNCLIVSHLEGDMKHRFLRASHIDTIFQVQPMDDITTLGDNVIGYEIPRRHSDTHCIDAIIQDLARFVYGDVYSHTKNLFVMHEKIYKREITTATASTLVNFKKHQLGFVPVLVGKNSYKRQTNYLGFKASDEGKITV